MQCAWPGRGRRPPINEAGMCSVSICQSGANQYIHPAPSTRSSSRLGLYDTSRVILRPGETLVGDIVARGIVWKRHARTRRPPRYHPSRTIGPRSGCKFPYKCGPHGGTDRGRDPGTWNREVRFTANINALSTLGEEYCLQKPTKK